MAVLLTMGLGRQQRLSAAYLLLPIGAYFFGSFLSEWMGKTIKRMHFLRWDTLLIALEMCAVVFLALMPAAWPDQICQVTLNFVCAMQFNTYRQMEGVPAATTFVTNHIRQIGSNLAKLIRHPEDHGLRRKVKAHTSLLLCFTGSVGNVGVMALPVWHEEAVLDPELLPLSYADSIPSASSRLASIALRAVSLSSASLSGVGGRDGFLSFESSAILSSEK